MGKCTSSRVSLSFSLNLAPVQTDDISHIRNAPASCLKNQGWKEEEEEEETGTRRQLAVAGDQRE